MAVKEGLLALMREQPRYGYELKTEFEHATGGIWTLNVGQVYTTLDRLERDGLVQVELVDENNDDDGDRNGSSNGRGSGPQKHYSLTPAGQLALQAWWEETPQSEPARDELLLKVLIAIQQSRTIALEVITRHRTALTAALQRRRQELRRSTADGDDASGDLAARLVADALIVRAEANLRWLDQCEAQVLAAPADAFALGEESRL